MYMSCVCRIKGHALVMTEAFWEMILNKVSNNAQLTVFIYSLQMSKLRKVVIPW